MFRVICLMFFAFTTAGYGTEASLLGVWLTENQKATVEITTCEGNENLFCGKIIALKNPLNDDGSTKIDKHNENESLRTRPIIGINIIDNFIQESDTEYNEGRIYNPEDGNYYDSDIEFKDTNTIKVSGCILSFLCKTQIWTRKTH